jgi:hypothetical protein
VDFKPCRRAPKIFLTHFFQLYSGWVRGSSEARYLIILAKYLSRCPCTGSSRKPQPNVPELRE